MTTTPSLEVLENLIETVIEPAAAEVDRNGTFPRASIDALLAAGFGGLISSPDVGGAGAGGDCAGSVLTKSDPKPYLRASLLALNPVECQRPPIPAPATAPATASNWMPCSSNASTPSNPSPGMKAPGTTSAGSKSIWLHASTS